MLNLTPHAITIRTADGSVTIQPSLTVARVLMEEIAGPTTTVSDEHGQVAVPIIRRQAGEVEGLPEEGVQCIVSAMVLAAVPGRAGVYAPDTGSTAIRDDKGHIVAVTRLVAT